MSLKLAKYRSCLKLEECIMSLKLEEYLIRLQLEEDLTGAPAMRRGRHRSSAFTCAKVAWCGQRPSRQNTWPVNSIGSFGVNLHRCSQLVGVRSSTQPAWLAT